MATGDDAAGGASATRSNVDVGHIARLALAIVGVGAVAGLIIGALADHDAGFWAFIGMGAGAAIAAVACGIRVVQQL